MSKIKLLNGSYLDYEHPVITKQHQTTIAYSLASEQRFTNQLHEKWSVLQHVLLVTKIVELLGGSFVEIKQALHHDDPEAFLHDLPSPLKALLPDYKKYYGKMAKAMGDAFDVDIEHLCDKVKLADKYALIMEEECFSNTKPAFNVADVPLSISMKIIEFIEDLEKLYEKELVEIYIELDEQLSYKINQQKQPTLFT